MQSTLIIALNKLHSSRTMNMAMRSPLGSLLANVVMATLENNQLQQTLGDFDLYCRYVDDKYAVITKMLLSQNKW